MDAVKKLLGRFLKKPNLGACQRKTSPSSRAMKYPYTFSAKIAQFPIMHYYKNSWVYRYYCYSLVVSIPIFWKLQCMSNSPGNVQKWEELKAKARAEDEAAHDH
ncbi:hypothetical protein PPYR_12276 [Photinus pyralis]|uniref:Uncharacterized protein n=2 Tax=Photinus pyralis TaxID=7054 RepID=A0A5N4ADM7_PHOPY|nr:hypothetical protein PPYR_12276 [Photinus pyralis]